MTCRAGTKSAARVQRERTRMLRAAAEFTPLDPFGIEVRNVDLSGELDEGDVRSCRKCIQPRPASPCFAIRTFRRKHKSLSPNDFGELEVHVRQEYALPGYPQIHVVSNVKKDGPRYRQRICRRQLAHRSVLHAKNRPDSPSCMRKRCLATTGDDRSAPHSSSTPRMPTIASTPARSTGLQSCAAFINTTALKRSSGGSGRRTIPAGR